MPLTPLFGSSTSPSAPNALPNDLPTDQAGIVATMPFVSDSALNKFAIDTTQYVNTTKQLLGFAKGKRVLVTYYRLLNRESVNNRTNVADLATARNVIDTEYQKILNLEITLPKEFEFQANNSQANMSIAGEAMMYPNMNPSIGDIFTLGTGDGRVGMCRISQVTPMSWRQDRIYTVAFIVQEFLDNGSQNPIEGSVTLTSVFSKANYLAGTAALLSEQTYIQLNQIRAARTNLCRLYHQTFFDPDIQSYVRPYTIYDPWAVQFMTGKLSMNDLPIRPKNLLGQMPQLYGKTLWSRLEDRYNTSLYNVSPFYDLQPYRERRMGVFTTELFGRTIVYPSDDVDTGTYYLYSANFWSGNTAQMTAEELLIYEAITLRDCGDLGTLIGTYLEPVISLSTDDQYYKIPLYIHLIDMALQSKYREIDAPSMSYATNGDQ